MPKHLHPLGVLIGRPGLLRARRARKGSRLAAVSPGTCHRSGNCLLRSGPKPFSERGVWSPKRPAAVPADSSRSCRLWHVPFLPSSRGPTSDPAASNPLRSRRRCAPRSADLPVGRVLPEGSWATPSHPSVRRGPLEPGVYPPVRSVRLPFRVSVRVGLPGFPPIGERKRTRAHRAPQAEMRVGFRVSALLFAFTSWAISVVVRRRLKTRNLSFISACPSRARVVWFSNRSGETRGGSQRGNPRRIGEVERLLRSDWGSAFGKSARSGEPREGGSAS